MGRLESWPGLEAAQKKTADEEDVTKMTEQTIAEKGVSSSAAEVLMGGLRSPRQERAIAHKEALPVGQKEIMPREFAANKSESMRVEGTLLGAHRLTSEEQKAYAAAQLEEVALKLQSGDGVSEGDNTGLVDRKIRAAEFINGLSKSDELNPYGQVSQIVDTLKADIIKARLAGQNEKAIARMDHSLEIALEAQTVLSQAGHGLNEAIDQEVQEKYPVQYDPSGHSDEHKNTRRLVLSGYIRKHNQRIAENTKRRELLESA